MSNDTGSRPMTAETIHTCSYYCERPECIRRQRDELRDRMEAALAQQPVPPSVPEQKKLRVGNLSTLTDSEYPGLGDWWVQLWDGDEVFARAFGASPEEAHRRAKHIRAALAAQQQGGA